MSKPPLVLCVVAIVALCGITPSFARDTGTVVKVVDSGTLEVEVNGTTERVRLIGVDTLETFESDTLRRDVERTGQDVQTIKALGEQASAFTQRLGRPGTYVQLEYDQQTRDRDERLLACVWRSDGRMLNETLLCEGYANASTRSPFRHDSMDRFRTCERTAREQGKGLWGDGLSAQPSTPTHPSLSPVFPSGVIRGNTKSRIYPLPHCPNSNTLSAANVRTLQRETDALQAGYRTARHCPEPLTLPVHQA